MEPLIKITSVPILIEFKVHNAKLEQNNEMADLKITRDKGGLTIRNRPIKINIDTFEARNSVVPTTRRSIAQAAQKGIASAQDTTARYAREGKMLTDVRYKDNPLGHVFDSREQRVHEYGLGFLPSSPPNITWSEPSLSIQYETDKLNFDWKTSRGDFKYIPGNVEFSVKQRPSVNIEYIGEPIYTPPSADPNYVPIDIKA